ncbi:secretion protein [Comamonas thiooxydans]|uniref:HlyD family secretion protein n=1 Tax=Comamonas thiooxydans TaxID=363952 RepID=UPI0007C590F6|nr:HlyD family efflux transporter periplasmic adaptor subunit [Comamonas thiooxydans]OAD82483.1 secretion protein [Comamonas thiooxydans]
MAPVDFYRKEASSAEVVPWLGKIILTRPLSFTMLVTLAGTVTVTLFAILILGSYTKRTTVKGQLVPVGGQMKVYALQAGVILEKYVSEGMTVARGAPLYKISSERYDANASPVQAEISSHLTDRRDLLTGELEKARKLHADERDTLVRKLASISRESKALEAQIVSQRQLVHITKDASQRYQGLVEKGYISTDQFQQRQADHLAQMKVLQGLERELAALDQQRVERSNELSGLDLRQANQLAATDRLISAVKQELAESEARRTVLIRAPEAGVATAAFAEVGHSVDSGLPLVSIVPSNTQLEAELYAPSKSIGFIKSGDAVNIRYQAYPYQKFGIYKGQVLSISRSSIPPAELARTVNGIHGMDSSTEQLYRLRVGLSAQDVLAYGQPRPLQSGMHLDADIMQDKRRLYEWVLEPLFSLTGRV